MNRVLERVLVSIFLAVVLIALRLAPELLREPWVPAFADGVRLFVLVLWVPYLLELVISNGLALRREEDAPDGQPAPRPRPRR